MIFLLTVFVVFAVAGANGDRQTNELLDEVLDHARPEIAAQIDPLDLPSSTHRFSEWAGFFRVYGEARVYNGYMTGLKNIRRTGDSTIRRVNDMIYISAYLGVDGLQGSYRARATFMGIGPTASANIGISSVSVKIVAKQLTRTNASPEVTEFRITHLGHVHVSINGLGPLGWILSGLSTFIVNIIKPTIANAINQPLKQAIANELSKVHFLL